MLPVVELKCSGQKNCIYDAQTRIRGNPEEVSEIDAKEPNEQHSPIYLCVFESWQG